MSNLFISHSSRDNEAAAELQRRLQEKGHESVFLDFDPEQGIPAGTSWERTLYTKLRSCRAVVALCSENYLASQWCFAEIALARMEGKDLFALKIDPFGADARMPSILTEDQYIDLRADPEAGYQRLWNGFEVKGIVPQEARQLPPGQPPYPGLRAFEEADAPVFFGRDREIREGIELLNRVRRQGHPRLVMVLGSSGSGKSSLARAGLVPRLRRDAERWLVVGPFRPGRRPIAESALAFARAFEGVGRPRSREEILGRLGAEATTTPGAGPAEPEEGPSAREMLRLALQRAEAELGAEDAQLARSIDRLQDYLAASAGEPSAETAGAARSGRPDASPLTSLAADLRADSGLAEAKVVLVVDQFEELLGREQEGDDDPRNRFLRMLKAGIEAEDAPLLGLGTMRSDFLGMLQRSASLRGVGFKSLSVGPMSEEGMIQVIEEPATLGQIDLDKPALTQRLLRETGTPDALPLLAFTLRAMWDRFHETRRFDVEGYETLGGLRGAIAQVADDTLEAALATSETGTRKDLRIAFLSLARPAAEGSGWARQPVAWEEMPEPVRPMIQRFIDQRLLVKRADNTVEVAHEALFRSWTTLRRWLDANAEGLHLRREIRLDAEKWEQAASEEDKQEYLWRGGRLARALELGDRGVLQLSELARSFIDASESEENRRRAEEQARREAELEQARKLAEERKRSAEKALALAAEQSRSARRMRNAAVVIGIAFLVAIGLFFYAKRKREEAVEARLVAEDQTRIAVSSLWLERDPVRAALVLLELARPERQPQAGYLMRRALGHRLPLRELVGHEDLVMTAAYSPDGERIVTASRDGTARLWTGEGEPLLAAETGEPVVLEGHAGPLTTAFFDNRGERIVTASEDGTARVWLADGAPALAAGTDEPLVLDQQSPIWDVTFAPSGRWIATASKDKTVRLWKANENGAPLRTLPHEGEVNGLAFNRAGDRLVTVAAAKIHVWRIEADQVALERELPEAGEVLSVAFSPVDDRIVTGAKDGTVSVWSTQDGPGAELYGQKLVLPHQAAVRRAVFSPDGTQVFTASEDLAVRRWRADFATEPEVLFTGAVIPQWIELDPRSDRFVTAMVDGTARLWSAGVVDDGEPATLSFDGSETNAVYSPPGDRVVVATSRRGGAVELWVRDPSGGSRPPANGSPSESLAETSVFGTRKAGWTEPILLPGGADFVGGHSRIVLDTAFSPAGDRIVTISDDRSARIWRASKIGFPGLDESGPIVISHPAETQPPRINRADFHPRGDKVVTASEDGTARVWTVTGDAVETADGTEVVLSHDGPVTDAAFSPSGDRIVTSSKDGTARIWTADGTQLHSFPHKDEVASAAFSPRGDRVVTAARDNNGWIWRADGSGEPIRLKGHSKAVIEAAFDSSGTRVITGAKDRTARVWNADGTGEPLVLEGSPYWVVSAAFSPDGDRLLTASRKDVRIWGSFELLGARIRNATSVCLNPLFREKGLGEVAATARRRYERCRQCLDRFASGAPGETGPEAAFAAYRKCVRSPASDPAG